MAAGADPLLRATLLQLAEDLDTQAAEYDDAQHSGLRLAA